MAFCDRHKIDYVSAGKDHINIQCKWCGNADHGYHLAISLSGKGYRCFRAPEQHKGRSNPKLIQAILGCPWPEAFSIAGEESRGSSYAEGEFLSRAKELLGGGKKQLSAEIGQLKFPKEFRPLLPEGSGSYFLEYMAARGYTANDFPKLSKRYDLQCAISGFFKYRVIFPIYMNDRLVAWTGRTITKNTEVRYQTLSANSDVAERYGLPQATKSIEKTLWNYDILLKGGETLYICEGPFDALRLDFVGAKYGIHATCVFKKQISDEQSSLLDIVVRRFDRCILLFDPDAYLDTFSMRSKLAHLNLGTHKLPAGFDDPAEMSFAQTERFLGIS